MPVSACAENAKAEPERELSLTEFVPTSEGEFALQNANGGLEPSEALENKGTTRDLRPGHRQITAQVSYRGPRSARHGGLSAQKWATSSIERKALSNPCSIEPVCFVEKNSVEKGSRRKFHHAVYHCGR